MRFLSCCRLTLLSFFALLVGVGIFSASVRAEDVHERHRYLAGAIKEMIQDLSCEDDSQCRTVGYGYRPCGGFDAFLIYSVKNLNERALWNAATEYQQVDRQLAKGMLGACVIPRVPRVACIKHVCQETED